MWFFIENEHYHVIDDENILYLLMFQKSKMSEKVDFIAVKITQILLNTQKKLLDILQIFKKKLCEYIS